MLLDWLKAWMGGWDELQDWLRGWRGGRDERLDWLFGACQERRRLGKKGLCVCVSVVFKRVCVCVWRGRVGKWSTTQSLLLKRPT